MYNYTFLVIMNNKINKTLNCIFLFKGFPSHKLPGIDESLSSSRSYSPVPTN